eukprot:14496632-Ditylum_brightwellii.AAC.1
MLCPHIERLDPKYEDTDLVYFNGASNVQSGGEVLLDLSKLAIVRNLIVKYRCIYAIFRSGSQHSPYASFMKISEDFN